MSQYTVIYKYGKRTRQLKIKRKLKKSFPQEILAEAPELNERKGIEPLENKTPGSTKKATWYGAKIVQRKNLKLFLDNLSIRVRVSQSKTL